MERKVFAAGSVLAGLGVVFGAFGAHALEASLGPKMLETFETGVRYQMYHGPSAAGPNGGWCLLHGCCWPGRWCFPGASISWS